MYENVVEVSADGGNAIAMVWQNRGKLWITFHSKANEGSGTYGDWIAVNNYFHHNHVTFLQSPQGLMGGAIDVAPYQAMWEASANNKMDFNTYHVTNLQAGHFAWNNANRDFESLQGLGQELNGAIDLNTAWQDDNPTVSITQVSCFKVAFTFQPNSNFDPSGQTAVLISVDVTDNIGINRVEFYAGDTLI